MKIFRLTEKDRELFLDMDPLLMMERLEFPGAFAMAAVMEGEDNKEDTPVGLIICIDTGKSIVVQWLCVAAGYRKKGVGEHLLAAVFDAAVKTGYATVCAYINEEYGRGLICQGEERYLHDRLFIETKPLAGEWVTDINTLKNIAVLTNKKPEAGNIRVVPLRALLPGDRRSALCVLSHKKYMASLYTIDDKFEYLDLDVSCLLYDGDELSGGLLVQRVRRINAQLQGDNVKKYIENVLYPVCMCIGSASGIKALLATVIEAAANKYSGDSEVHVLMNKGYYAPLMERILPDSRIDNKLLIAFVEDYQKQDDEFMLQMLLSLG